MAPHRSHFSDGSQKYTRCSGTLKCRNRIVLSASSSAKWSAAFVANRCRITSWDSPEFHSDPLKCCLRHMNTADLACLGVSAIEICSRIFSQFSWQA